MPSHRKKSSTARPNSPAAKRAAAALRKKAQSDLDRVSRRTVTKKAAPKKKSAARKAKSRSYR